MSPFSTVRSVSQEEHIPFEKPVSVYIDDDKQSTTSQDILRAEHTFEALQLVAGNRVRHARCAPEFLEEVAGAHFKKFTSKKFKIITGSEANSFFKNYIMCVHFTFEESLSNFFASEHKQNAPRTDNDNLTNNKAMLSPVVFAVTVWEAGLKCVDYYMTWRGKTVSTILFLDAPSRTHLQKKPGDSKGKHPVYFILRSRSYLRKQTLKDRLPA